MNLEKELESLKNDTGDRPNGNKKEFYCDKFPKSYFNNQPNMISITDS